MMDLPMICLHIIIWLTLSNGNVIKFSHQAATEVSETRLPNEPTPWANETVRGKHRTSRKATLNPDRLWPGAIVPYLIQVPAAKDSILESLKIWEVKTCVKFITYDEDTTKLLGHTHRVSFVAGNGCSSTIGSKRSGEQVISIGKKCANVLTVLHELGHVIGLHHEQERTDRDDYVRVLWLNIQEEMAYNFEKRSTLTSTPYDFHSIMHYKRNSFSVNSNPTIVTRDPLLQYNLGSKDGVTFYDAMTVNRIYNCNRNCLPKDCKNGGYVGPHPYCYCVCPPGYSGIICEVPEKNSHKNECKEKLTSPYGTLSSPNYPHKYSNNVNCMWYIEAKPGQKITLTFTNFSLEDSNDCKRDKVRVRTDNMYQDDNPSMCGPAFRRFYTSKRHQMLVLFKSDYTFQSAGFQATYMITDRDPDIVDYSNCLGRSCYTFIEKQIPWQEANAVCEQMNGNLPVISTAEENEFIRLKFGEVMNGRFFWIGLAYTNERDRWQWVVDEEQFFVGWTMYTVPSKHDTGCVMTSVYGKWTATECNSHNADIVCETYTSKDTHAEWQKWQQWESCTLTCGGGLQRRQRQCNLPGLCKGSDEEWRSCNQLICPGSRAQGKLASQSSTVIDASYAVDGRFWVRTLLKGACSRTHHQWEPWWKVDLGIPQLVHRLTITKKGFFSGLLVGAVIRIGNSPDSLRSNGKCSTPITRDDVDSKYQVSHTCRNARVGRYVSIQLERKYGVIELCEVQVFATDCQMFDGRCYFQLEKKLNYQNARKSCLASGAALVNIASKSENKHVQDICEGGSFLNLRYNRLNRGWVSDTNTFLNWAALQPITSKKRPKKKCVVMKPNGRWETSQCNSLRKSVCSTI